MNGQKGHFIHASLAGEVSSWIVSGRGSEVDFFISLAVIFGSQMTGKKLLAVGWKL